MAGEAAFFSGLESFEGEAFLTGSFLGEIFSYSALIGDGFFADSTVLDLACLADFLGDGALLAGAGAFLSQTLTGETPFIGDELFPFDKDLAGAAFAGLVGLTKVVSGRPSFTGELGFDESLNVLKPRVPPSIFSWA